MRWCHVLFRTHCYDVKRYIITLGPQQNARQSCTKTIYFETLQKRKKAGRPKIKRKFELTCESTTIKSEFTLVTIFIKRKFTLLPLSCAPAHQLLRSPASKNRYRGEHRLSTVTSLIISHTQYALTTIYNSKLNNSRENHN